MSIQTDQIVSDDTLDSLGSAAREQLKVLFARLNKELDAPLRLHATQPTADAVLNFSASSILLGDGAHKSFPALKSQIMSLAVSTINFQTQATTGATFSVTWPGTNTLNYYRSVGFTLLSSGSIQMLFSAEAATTGALVNAGTLFVKSGIPLGYIILKCTDTLGKWKTANSATSIIENADIYRFGSGGGTGSGSSTGSAGGELADLMYSAKVMDVFSDLPDGTTTVDIAAGKTNSALYDSSNNLFRLSYDASKTVTGTGVNMTLSGTPAFTVAIGNVLSYNGETRRIITVTSQTVYVLDYAFATDPTAGACCVSQAVHTVDLNNFTNNGQVQSVASQFSGNVDEIMLGYWDSTTLGSAIPTYGTAPVIAYSASTDGASWTTNRVRATSLSSSENAVTCNTSNPNLYLRFFANQTSGSGAVNLLKYKVFFQKIFGQTVGGTYYTAFARPTSSIAQNCVHSVVGGKSRFTFTFSYTRGLNPTEASGSMLEVIANGQIIPRVTAGITDSTQGYFTEINDNTIEMDTDYSLAGIDFQFKVQRVGIIDTNTQNTSKNALHDDLFDQNLDAQVIPTWLTAINGSPVATQFRSDITGRASIPDLSSMLSVQMGPQRMMTQEIYQLQNEFGASGQPVFGVVNDKFNQIRFVGSWVQNNNAWGARPTSTANSTDYCEIIFYGTGLNLNTFFAATTYNFVASIDGSSETTNLTPSSYSSVLAQRNYSPNTVLNICSGLSLGLHTVKIRNNNGASNPIEVCGFEILTETTSLRVMPGTVAKGKYKNVLSAIQTVAYDSNFETGTLGTKGGCVLVYLKNDGTIGKALTPTDSAAGYLTGASHTNEEVIRAYCPTEFGAGRADDFSLYHSNSALAFTLDDGVTTLTGSAMDMVGTSAGVLQFRTNNNFITFTFVGTGLDILRVDTGTTSVDAYAVTIDGVSQGTLSTTLVTTPTQVKICSGLPYGTHTVKISFGAIITSGRLGINQFIVYAPKKPALPVGAIELGQYYKTANYVANITTGLETIGSGLIRKYLAREIIYVGTWTLSAVSGTILGGMDQTSSTTGDYIQYTFFGTGFDFRYQANTDGATAQINLNGIAANTTNYATMVSASYGTGSFAASTGVLTQTGTSTPGSGLSISNLPLALYTVRITKTGGTNMRFSCLDIITPIHTPASNGPYVLQNTLTLGNNSVIDLRKFNKRDLALSNMPKIAMARSITASASTTSGTNIPLQDMSISYYSEGEFVSLDLNGAMSCSVIGQAWSVQFAVNGIMLSPSIFAHGFVANLQLPLATSKKIYLPKGYHKIDAYWSVSGGATTTSEQRQLTVTKLGAN